jgi:hypothetical protein
VTELAWVGGAPPAALHRPVLVTAFTGWFDAAGAATAAVRHLSGADEGLCVPIASIDPETFFDFTRRRPTVALDPEGQRVVSWPRNEFAVRSFGDAAAHDLVVLTGEEPHLRWSTFADLIVDVAQETGSEMVVTAGAAIAEVPHTRPPQVVGSTTSAELARRLGLGRPTYEGVTGLIGVLHERIERAELPAISLRVGVPHYLATVPHPLATVALLQHLEHVLGVPTGLGELAEDVDEWRRHHDEAVALDPDAAAYVARLEGMYDEQVVAEVPSPDELAAELEAFLRDHRPD